MIQHFATKVHNHIGSASLKVGVYPAGQVLYGDLPNYTTVAVEVGERISLNGVMVYVTDLLPYGFMYNSVSGDLWEFLFLFDQLTDLRPVVDRLNVVHTCQ